MPEPEPERPLVVDAANVVGSTPNGWWRDRPGAARGLVERIVRAVARDALPSPVVVVLEGTSRSGMDAGRAGDGVEVVHAPQSGDDAIVDVVAATRATTVVTADRALAARVRDHDAEVVGPRWLLDRLAGGDQRR
jgi:hypothetical protein